MEVSFEPLQINDISTMSKNCITEDNSIYEECSICCESFTNKSFINECLHPFCYQCIIDWTKVKAVCPLCIGPITSILHNIRSQDDYDIEKVEPPRVDVLANIDNDFIFDVDDTDTESSYGGMESMDMESDYDNSIIYENDDFEDANYDNETGNFFGYLSNNESSHDDVSVHSNEHDESEDEVEAEIEVEDNDSSSSAQEEEDDDDDDEEDGTHGYHNYYNADSESDAEDEHADDEYDHDSNDDDDDADLDNDNDNNYFDNYDDDDDDEDEDEPEHEYSTNSDDDNDANEEAETFDVSDDSCEEPDVEYNPTSTSEEEYYY